MYEEEKNIILKFYKTSKFYSKNFELKEFTSQIKSDKITGFLGGNGAGKSTLFELVSGNLDITSGSILFKEEKISPEKYLLKRKIGYVPQRLSLPPWSCAFEILTYAAQLYQLSSIEERTKEQLKMWDCDSYKKKPICLCSHGMQKRVALALATIHKPELLILDEPFSGLDLFHTKALKEYIKSRKEEKKTTLLSTHIMPYAIELCDEVYIIKTGKILKLEKWENYESNEKKDLLESEFFLK